MDVSSPISSLVPTLDGPVLAVLARTRRPLTGREVHRLAGAGSESGVRLALNRLERQGVVLASQAGRADLYVANREHVAWPAAELLVALRQELFDRIASLVSSWDPAPTVVAVFGSAARGDGDSGSDIDILLVRADGVNADDRGDELRERVTAWCGNACQIYELDMAGFHAHVQADEPIVAEWLRDAVTLFGTPVGDLVGSGAGS